MSEARCQRQWLTTEISEVRRLRDAGVPKSAIGRLLDPPCSESAVKHICARFGIEKGPR